MVINVYSRKVVGWAFGERMTADLVILALNMALMTRKPQSVIHHSDQGSQGGFNRSSQHRVRRQILNGCSVPPMESSNPTFFVACC
jgi:transposase InsO family protein